jgi:hypothetical protein
MANGNPISQQSITKEMSTKVHNRDRIIKKASDMAALAINRITSTLIALLQPIIEALNRILDGKDSIKHIIDRIFRYIRESERSERVIRERQEI